MSQIKPAAQPVVKRLKTFAEASIGFNKKSMIDEALRYPPPDATITDHGCPLGVDVPGFVRSVREGDPAGALAKVREQNELPGICGRICPAPCEKSGILEKMNLRVSVRALERYVSDHGRPRFNSRKTMLRTGKKVAVVGSGPAGLTAAAIMARAGLKVTVHEILPLIGGCLRYSIPEFRLPKNVLDAEIEEIRALGVEFKTNFAVGHSTKWEQFLSEGYSAVLLTIGKNSLVFEDIPGADLAGVYYANEVLLAANTRFEDQYKRFPTPKIGRKVAVIGNNNAALDSARVCLRLGREVALLISETVDDLNVYPDEADLAKEEGLRFEPLTRPLSLIAGPSEPGAVMGVQCVRMDFADPEGSGSWKLCPVPGSEFIVEADTVVLAAALRTSVDSLGSTRALSMNEQGAIKVDPETGRTSVAHLYAAGDAVLSAPSVVHAMASAKKTALAIINSLK